MATQTLTTKSRQAHARWPQTASAGKSTPLRGGAKADNAGMRAIRVYLAAGRFSRTTTNSVHFSMLPNDSQSPSRLDLTSDEIHHDAQLFARELPDGGQMCDVDQQQRHVAGHNVRNHHSNCARLHCMNSIPDGGAHWRPQACSSSGAERAAIDSITAAISSATGVDAARTIPEAAAAIASLMLITTTCM